MAVRWQKNAISALQHASSATTQKTAEPAQTGRAEPFQGNLFTMEVILMVTALPRGRPVCLAALVTAALMTASACGSGATRTGTSAKPSAPASPAATSHPPARGATGMALAAYTGMWAEMQAAGVTADWKDPRLAQYASGAALRTLVAGLRAAHRKGIVIKGTIATHPRVVSAAPADHPRRVRLADCLDDTHWLNYVAATGKLQNDVPGGHHLTQAVVIGAGGQWKVTRLVVRQVGTC
jgi:hypothetical protein